MVTTNVTISSEAFVIGLTGPFGSGCTTAAGILRDYAQYEPITLSSMIVNEWTKKNPGLKPTRSNLQALGNTMRMDAANPGICAQLAVRYLEGNDTKYNRVVFDGIRNVGEIQYLRDRFGHRFYLFALECRASDRFERLVGVYGSDDQALTEFTRDNENDRDQETPNGQQVALCVDLADALVINGNDVTLSALRSKLLKNVKVVTGEEPRYAEPLEILMNFAYSAAHGSKCLKRQVGAVIVNAPPGNMGDIVGQGFNENPRPTLPCVEEPQYGADSKSKKRGSCYRDIVRVKSLASLSKQGVMCPKCGTPIAEPKPNPPWICSSCGDDLERFFWPERAMTLCTAIHAEVAAIFAAGRRAKGATLYTTTYPCFQCAEKIKIGRAHV